MAGDCDRWISRGARHLWSPSELQTDRRERWEKGEEEEARHTEQRHRNEHLLPESSTALDSTKSFVGPQRICLLPQEHRDRRSTAETSLDDCPDPAELIGPHLMWCCTKRKSIGGAKQKHL